MADEECTDPVNYDIEDCCVPPLLAVPTVGGIVGPPGPQGPAGPEGGIQARRVVQFTTASLANEASESSSHNFAAPGMNLLMISVDRPARVRFYAYAGIRNADAARPASETPDSGTGIFLDAVWASVHTKYIAPTVKIWNGDSPATAMIYYTVTNLSGASSPVTVTCTVVSTERLP